ncbi:hypothetical protein [Sporosarcina sp. G11-34]|uniref:hypothetical protein n=1 Tax=Sporosarcina sp. G11-34 TaxID=2849605 RepID=UPI0022A96071|nr:hypothetical protein [Sporosarcina sp. G11-34]MCZ2260787.1 hypothetical protein [Sporosarcina sp. G11-34]
MKKLLVIVAISVLLIGCKGKEMFYQTDLEGITDFMENNAAGFILVVTDNDEYFIEDIRMAASKEKVKIAMYNVYEPTIGEKENRPNFPYSSDLKGSTLYYVADNTVQGELVVNKYADLQLTQEISNFIKNHK